LRRTHAFPEAGNLPISCTEDDEKTPNGHGDMAANHFPALWEAVMSAASTTRCLGARSAAADSPLDHVEAAFRLLVTGSTPLAVHGDRIGHGLPRRPIPVDELRCILRHPSSSAARDPAWREIIRLTRTGQPEWTIAAVALALPGLRRLAGQFSRGYDGDPADLDAEILTAFLETLKSIDPDRPRIALRLWRAARRAGLQLRHADAPYGARHTPAEESSVPPQPCGHPDFVLASAVRQGVITGEEADLIGRTRLEEVPLLEIARELGVSYNAAKNRRWRAEARLVQAIRDAQVTGASMT